MLYESVVVRGAILLAVVCWGRRLKAADKHRLNKLIRNLNLTASDVVGVELDSLTAVSDRTLSKLPGILMNSFHPLHNE